MGVSVPGGYSLGMRQEFPVRPVLVRELIGESLREERVLQGKTLREVSKAGRVSLGYLSEVERGQKEASSELLAAICGALDLPLSVVLSVVSEKMAMYRAGHPAASDPGAGPSRRLTVVGRLPGRQWPRPVEKASRLLPRRSGGSSGQ